MERSNIRYKEVQNIPRDSEDSDSETVTSPAEETRTLQESVYKIVLWTSIFWITGAFLMYLLFFAKNQKQECPPRDQLSYSPAQDFIRYKQVVFTNGFTEISQYQGRPSAQLDTTWYNLYTHMTRVPKNQALLLANHTIEIPGDPGYYAVIFDVFHSLHCLDELRKEIWPDYYRPFAERYHVTKEIADLHLDHCVDGLRQALMCSADIATIPFRFGVDKNDIKTVAGHLHTCRDWDAFEEYVIANEIQVPFHAKTKAEDSVP